VTAAHLEALGWHVVTIWECELRGASSVDVRINALADAIRSAGLARMQRQDLARRNRQENERKLKELQERQARLEAEINALYPIPSRIRKEARGEIL
jgi:hypothetical protein